jgi:hypothetical protein
MIFLPVGQLGKICLHLASQDGRFSAAAEYLINNSASNYYRLAFQSSHPEFQHYSISSIAALAQIKTDCASASSEAQPILPVFWTTNGLTFPIRVMLQTDQGDARLISSQLGAPPLNCSAVPSGAQVVFDQVCLIPGTWKQYLAKPLSADIRDVSGIHAPLFGFSVKVP